MSGLKPGQRKVLFCCFKRNDKREVKVAQLAGSVAEMSAYHHGEVRWCTEFFFLVLLWCHLMMIIGIRAPALVAHPIWSRHKLKKKMHMFAGLSDDDYCWFGPKLCGKQQFEPAAASGPVWNQATRWQGLCQSSIHLHHAEVRTCTCMLARFESYWPFVIFSLSFVSFSVLPVLSLAWYFHPWTTTY